MWIWAALSAHAEPVELTLTEALDRVTSDAPDAVLARARADVARAVARQAAAAWQPVVAVSASVVRNDNEVVLSFGDLLGQLPIPVDVEAPDEVVIQPLQAANAAATARIPLFAPSAWAAATAAGRRAEAAQADLAEARLQLEAGLVTAAASAEAAEGVVAAARRAVDVADDHRAATEVARAAGTATAVDVLAARADLARRRSERVQAEAALATAQEALGALLGIDGPVRVALPDAAAPEDPAAVTRPALASAATAVEAAHANASAANLRYLPTVAAVANARAATVPYPTGNPWAWQIGVEAAWTLYDGGLRGGQRRQAGAELAAAEAARTAAELRVSREVRDAERDLRVAREQLTLAEEQSALASEAADVAQRGLAAGTVSPLQARDTDIQAFSAEVGVAGARARVRIAEAALRRARGLDQRW